MLEAIDIDARIPFVFSKDTGKNKTEIIIRPLLGMDRIVLAGLLDEKEGTEKYLKATLKKSVVEIRNPDIKEEDAVVKFVSGLDMTILTELFDKIKRVSETTVEEEKN